MCKSREAQRARIAHAINRRRRLHMPMVKPGGNLTVFLDGIPKMAFQPSHFDISMVESSVLRTCFAQLLPHLRFVAIAQSSWNLRF